MVKVMPTQNSVFGLQRAMRALMAGVLCVLAVLCAAGSARAQGADASSSDDWFSSIFSTYGVTIFLVTLLVGLLVFRKVRARKDAQELAAARSGGRASRSQSSLAARVTPPR